MRIAQKIRKYGIAGSLRRAPNAIRYRADDALYRREYAKFQRLPIDGRLVVLESEGDLSDNAYALYDHMREAGYLERYRVVWAVDDLDAAVRLKEAEPDRWPNTEFVCKTSVGPWGVNHNLAKALATCRWLIFDHCNLMSHLAKRDEQELVYLSHGWGYKAPKGADSASDVTRWDLMTATGPLAAKGLAEYWQYPLEKSVVTGYPRLDYLFEDDPVVSEKVNEAFHLSDYRKVVFWMPTFRKSVASTLSEDYIHNETGLPIFNTLDDLRSFSTFLKAKDILLVFKLHHLQAELPVFQEKFDNIIVVRDEELHYLGLQLYQFVRFADALISDYSSIAIDYLVMDRPIVFTLDDYEQYAKSRGLFPEDAIDYMPGYHVYDEAGLEDALSEIADGIDRYKEERSAIVGQYHTYKDGGSSKRVLKAAGID